MQDKHWLEEKKVESSSKSNMDHGLSAFGSVPLQHKRGTLSARSWNIQDEVRKVRFKAAEDMLHALPSKRNGLFIVSEHKTFQNLVVPGGGSSSTVDKMHVSKSLPEKEHVDASIKLLSGPSTIHDSKDSFALGLKQDGMQAENLPANPSTSVSERNQHLTVEGATTTDSHHSMSLEHLVKQHNGMSDNDRKERSGDRGRERETNIRNVRMEIDAGAKVYDCIQS